jgi:hypothetical protein
LRRCLRLALAALALFAAACATPLPTPQESGFLVFWRVARADGSTGAWLLGSIHVAREAIAFDPAIARGVAESDVLALELAPGELSAEEAAALLYERGSAPPGKTLRDLVSWRTWHALERNRRARGQSAEALLPFEPWAVGMMLVTESFAAQGLDEKQGVEASVGKLAWGKPVVGLETLEEQIAALDALPYSVQDWLLRDSLGSSAGRDVVDVLFEAWRRGDLDALEAMALPGGGEEAETFAESVFLARNERLAERIAQRVEAGGVTFVAVGAGHLVGARGVPSLLAARGYRVERVPKTEE